MNGRLRLDRAVGVLIAIALPLASSAIYADIASAQTATSIVVSPIKALAAPETAPAIRSAQGVRGTTTSDLASFASEFNAQRVAHDLAEIPLSNIRYDACLEQRLFWIAEDPSANVASAWGHAGSVRSDGLPAVGCDGNLAGGTGNTGAEVAVKWWNSFPHRESLYKPFYEGSLTTVCIHFAMTHGGVPDEPTSVTRAAARWGTC